MPALFIYLIKVNVALLIFCAGYYAVLRHLTFYNLNRIYLVTAIIFSTLYPKINLVSFLNRHEEIARPMQIVVLNWQQPVQEIAKTFLGHDIWFWLFCAFWFGVSVFAIRLLTQLLSLYKLHQRSQPAQIQQYMIRAIKGNINPFSFWRNIYINPDNHPAQELEAILEHEQIHVSEWHTLDILLGEVSAIFYWFNPGVWLMKRAIRENIEFITDNKILQKGVDCKAYQYSLLNVNFGAQGNAIVNHFNISTIKKRIMMMNAKRSSKVNVTRYLFLIPAVMVLLLVFSVSKADMNKAVKNSKHIVNNITTAITKISFTAVTTASSSLQTVGAKALNMLTIQHTAEKDAERAHVDSVLNQKTFFYQSVSVKDGDKHETLFLRADTGKKVVLTINGVAESNQPDIYIDGVKSERRLSELNLNPNQIESINVVKDRSTSPNGAVYILTKGHNPNVILDTVIIKNLGQAMVAKPTDANKEIMVIGHPTKITKIRINGKNYAASGEKELNNLSNHDTLNNSFLMVTNKKLDTLIKKLPGIEIMPDGTMLKTAQGTAVRQSITVKDFPIQASANSSIKLTNRLIIIDGKEASAKQLKKISADKIESISNLSADLAKATYGDKAKNGVVVITTKN